MRANLVFLTALLFLWASQSLGEDLLVTQTTRSPIVAVLQSELDLSEDVTPSLEKSLLAAASQRLKVEHVREMIDILKVRGFKQEQIKNLIVRSSQTFFAFRPAKLKTLLCVGEFLFGKSAVDADLLRSPTHFIAQAQFAELLYTHGFRPRWFEMTTQEPNISKYLFRASIEAVQNLVETAGGRIPTQEQVHKIFRSQSRRYELTEKIADQKPFYIKERRRSRSASPVCVKSIERLSKKSAATRFARST
jgi:hypothetical protein